MWRLKFLGSNCPQCRRSDWCLLVSRLAHREVSTSDRKAPFQSCLWSSDNILSRGSQQVCGRSWSASVNHDVVVQPLQRHGSLCRMCRTDQKGGAIAHHMASTNLVHGLDRDSLIHANQRASCDSISKVIKYNVYRELSPAEGLLSRKCKVPAPTCAGNLELSITRRLLSLRCTWRQLSQRKLPTPSGKNLEKHHASITSYSKTCSTINEPREPHVAISQLYSAASRLLHYVVKKPPSEFRAYLHFASQS